MDPNRVGGPTNALLGENVLSTTIGAAAGLSNDAASNALRRMAARWVSLHAGAAAAWAVVQPQHGSMRSEVHMEYALYIPLLSPVGCRVQPLGSSGVESWGPARRRRHTLQLSLA